MTEDCPERRLARAVIGKAVNDAKSERGDSVRDDARAFLRGGIMLEFWCHIAGVSVDRITHHARQWPIAA